jgi:hypothetical protein
MIKDDGSGETHRFVEIEATVGARTRRFTIPAARFPGMSWVNEQLGTEAIVYPGIAVKDHARAAIQMLSPTPAERVVYAHTGWREIDGLPMYLHAGGAIGASGTIPGIEVNLPLDLANFSLPEAPTGTRLRDAVCASLAFAFDGPAPITLLLAAALYRAVLKTSDFTLHLAGATGVFKTALAALVQAHWGPKFTDRNLPARWSSTENALEALAFTAKDALLVVDDFAPSGTAIDVARLHRVAERLVRAQGNLGGRQRMRADTSLRPAMAPRGTTVSTGEDVPRGHSVRARMPVLEVRPGDVNVDRLTACQGNASKGLYAEAMAGYIQWLATRYQQLHANLPEVFRQLRAIATRSDAHRRMADIVAQLALGMGWFLRFAHDFGLLRLDEVEFRWRKLWRALGEMAAAQTQHHAAVEPTGRFLDLLRAALIGGSAHIAGINGDPNGDVLRNASLWGWRERNGELQPQGERIGWTDGEAVYLQADVAYAVAQRLARTQNEEPLVGLVALKKRLHDKKLIKTETRGDRLRLEVRCPVKGRPYVLQLSAELFHSDELAQVAQTRDSENCETFAPPAWATLWATAEVAHPVAHDIDEETPAMAGDSACHSTNGPLGPHSCARETATEAVSDENEETEWRRGQ